MMRSWHRGQAIAEYAILFGIVTMAILGMQVYAKRGLQASVKQFADQIGPQQDGLVDTNPEFEWKRVGCSNIDSQVSSTHIVAQGAGGTVNAATAQSATRSGTLSDPSC